jgi:subtilisin family serine protease
VINLSLGAKNYSAELEAAVQDAVAAGKVVVASAGNYGENSLLYPAQLEETIAVGAVNSQFKAAAYSHSGSMLDVLAPGGDDGAGVLSTVLNEDYGYMAGTSMAAPHVSALAALMLERGIRASEIKTVLHQSSIHPGEDKFSLEYGYGIINANFAYNNLQELKIVVGNREGNQINAVAEERIPLAGGKYELRNFSVGEYSVFAWIDVNNNDIIDAEDYLVESESLDFKTEGDYQQNLELILD